VASYSFVEIRDSIGVTEANVETESLRQYGKSLVDVLGIKFFGVAELLGSHRHNPSDGLVVHE
jgi:hypothetical protein